MGMIKGITVTLFEEVKTGVDPFGAPVYEEVPVEVENVLVAPTSSEDIITDQNLYGKKSVYTLAIPKGDTHDWRNKKVAFFGQMFRTFDMPVYGIEDMIPLSWNAKVKVERYE
jgi:hypothetical protein